MNEAVTEDKEFIRGREPKIITLDVEISPLVALTFGAYESNAFKIERESVIMAASWQVNDGKIKSRILPDYKYKKGLMNLDDTELCRELYDVLQGGDVLVGHNLARFDVKHLRTRFFRHGLPPTKPWRVEDTLTMARKYFSFAKNNLDYLTEMDGIGTKTEKRYSDLVMGCIEGDMKNWNELRHYNAVDVELTKKLYKRLAPWHSTHYNLNLIRRVAGACPSCGSKNWRKRGVKFYPLRARQQHSCNSCGKWWTGEYIARAVDGNLQAIIQSNP